ncbi:MAG: ribonucleoside-diphosphate reductase alpha chain [Myxococcota bacterium]|jgi:ribonucleoside-diphosphate reductase alpha chain
MGLRVERRHTEPGGDPYGEVTWERRVARISGPAGVVFEQENVEFPDFWSQQATNVVASRYFRGDADREGSVRELFRRVVGTIVSWGRADGYFASLEDAAAFEDELTWLLLHQRFSFNSPVWFNVGTEDHPQCSACFINSVEDTMESILELTKTEGMLFKFGSGTGTNLSPIRSSRERISGGGRATGPLSFMRGYDAFAGAIRSGGKTRRAAKMVILNINHPDVGEFIASKAAEERKAHALIAAGYDASFGGEAYSSVAFQNANHSVRVTDAFMRAVESDETWTLHGVADESVSEERQARELFSEMAQAAWECGDPGLQFDTTVNEWHTCPNTAPINASNPCSEFMFLDDTACNLASLNLLSFLDVEGAVGVDAFDVDAFEHAARLVLMAQEILVSRASYPTERIAENSRKFRPLGLGYANLGALLMTLGLPYDSDEGRELAAVLTGLMAGRAYATSAELAGVKGAFEGYSDNAEPMQRVVRAHAEAMLDVSHSRIKSAAVEAWREAREMGATTGYRNSQVTVIAPTGTIAFMMDCDTTGVEPELALVKYKQLSGGGTLRIVNGAVPRALGAMGYSEEETEAIVDYIEAEDTIEGAPGLATDHLPVFDCAFRAGNAKRSLSPRSHILMMAAVQPSLSGAISKTVNLPTDATPTDIEQVYLESWHLGLKSVAVYSDGCKQAQPLSTRKDNKATPRVQPAAASALSNEPPRQRLPDERQSLTHKFNIAGHEGYITVGCYPDGRPGEIFIKMAKQGSTLRGLMDSFAMSISVALQYGIPLDTLARKYIGTRFEPSGFTTHPEIPMAKSLMDYIFRWLQLKFETPLPLPSLPAPDASSLIAQTAAKMRVNSLPKVDYDAPPCPDCGTLMAPSGSCYGCPNCGATSGCS